MRLNLNKNIRKVIIFVLIILILFFTCLIYNEAYNTGFEEQKIPVYSYNNKGSINYTVYLKSNKLYNDNKLDEGKLYITEFVDYLEVNLRYEFIGEKDADVKAEYSTIANVQGFNKEGEKVFNIWEKDFLIAPNKTISIYDNKILINEKVKLNINEYNTFVEDIEEASKINCQTKLTLFMNVNLTGTTEKGAIEDSISTSLIIPLDVTMFEITGNNIVDKPGVIEEIIKVQIPVNKNLIITYGIIMAFLIMALMTLIFFSQAAPEKDQLEKALNKIFKNHGDRLVALKTMISENKPLIVKSIDDLVKIADEIGKPILYIYRDDYKKINKFYVVNDDEVFLLDLSYLNTTEQKKDTIIKNATEQIKTESQLNV